MEDDPLSQQLLRLPNSTKKDVATINCSLASSITLWLKKHGKSIRPKLTQEQKQQLKECFELMDQDGSGAIDAEELGAAFKLLGIRMKMSELNELLAEVDHDGSGEVEYLEFLEIMTTTLQRLAEERESEESAGKGEGQVPFALMATAYRRKRLMEGIISGDKEVMMQITQLSERQAAEAANAATREAAEEEAMRSNRGAEVEVRKMLNSITRKSLERLTALKVDKDLLMALSPEERRLLAQVAARVGTPPTTGLGFANLAGAPTATTAPPPIMSSPGVRKGGGGGGVRQSHVGFAAQPVAMLPPMAAATPSSSGRLSPQQPQLQQSQQQLHKQTPTWDGAIRAMATSQAGALSEFNDEHNRQKNRAAFGRAVDPGQHRLPIVPHSKWQHYSHTATHRQLLEMPNTFDFKFSKASTLKVGVPGGIKGTLPGIVARSSSTGSDA